MLSLLPRLALFVTDAGYFGYRLAEQMVRRDVMFLVRMSSNVRLHTLERVRMDRYREGEVYYWPSRRDRQGGNSHPLRLRLIRIRAKHHRHDLWLLTNVMDKKRLSHRLAGQMYRWRWQNEGCFRTYKHTLNKVKLVSRSVRLVHREAEGSWLAMQLLMGQEGHPCGDAQPAAGTPTGVRAALARSPSRASRTDQRQSQPHLAAPQATQAAKAAETPQDVSHSKE